MFQDKVKMAQPRSQMAVACSVLSSPLQHKLLFKIILIVSFLLILGFVCSFSITLFFFFLQTYFTLFFLYKNYFVTTAVAWACAWRLCAGLYEMAGESLIR